MSVPTDFAPFRLERDMVEPLQRGLPAALGGRGAAALRVLREPDLGLIIPDLLAGFWRSSAPAVRTRHTYVESCVLARLEHARGFGTQTLANALFMNPQDAATTLGRLERSGTVVQGRRGGWRLASGAGTSHIEIVAVEAKLDRWREALSQAREYLEFANRSVVVLDGARVRATPALLTAFREARVGLWFQCGDRLVQRVAAPRHQARSARRVLAADRLFGPLPRRREEPRRSLG